MNIVSKVTGDSLTATEFNQIPDELENLITSAGLSTSDLDLTQIRKSVAQYVADSNYYTTSGTSNAIVLTSVSPRSAQNALTNGTKVRFVASYNNTSSVTLNLNNLGAKTLLYKNQTLTADTLIANKYYEAIYISSSDKFELLKEENITNYINIADMLADTSLLENTICFTSGYYSANDGGEGKYLIRQPISGETIDNGLKHTLSNGLVAELLVQNSLVNVKQFGAKGDGTNDDTTAFQNALNSGNNVIFDESTYLITSSLLLDLTKTSLRGLSSRSVLNFDLPADTSALICYGDNTNYTTRKLRENYIGNFSMNSVGLNKCNGLQVGGIINTANSGQVECNLFQQIRINGFNKGLLLGAHFYRMLFIALDFDGCNYSLYTIDRSDSGEAICFLNCSLWTGSIYLTTQCIRFYNCTIHLRNQITVNTEVCSHYFKSCEYLVFDNCHFEIISSDNITLEDVFYFENTQCDFINCDAVASIPVGKIITLNKYFINTTITGGSGVSPLIRILGGDWKYLIGRFNTLSATNPLTNGAVLINFPKGYAYEEPDTGSGHNKYRFFSYSKSFQPDMNNNYERSVNTNCNMSQSVTDDVLEIKLTYNNSIVNTTPFWYHHKKDVSNCRMVHMVGQATISTSGAINMDLTSNRYCLFFVDDCGQIINPYTTKEQASFSYIFNNQISINALFTIPANAKYAYFGLGGYWTPSANGDVCTITSNICYEFM